MSEPAAGDRRTARVGDLLAGLTVALVLFPQALAYAKLAGMPPEHGLYASTLALIVAAPFASSPYLQTGPVAVTAVLTLSALAPLATPGSADYVELALLLAVLVGIARLAVGLLRGGAIAYLMSRPMLLGFMPGAAIFIAASQLPAAVGATPPESGVLESAGWTLLHPSAWSLTAIALAAVVVLAVLGGRRLHPLFPGVLVAVVVAVAFSQLAGYDGEQVGEIAVGAPPISLDLPWISTPELLVGALIIALVGFAEPASIARELAAKDRMPWNANREFVSQGAANVAAGLSGGFPIGGSFSRSSLNRLAGARTARSGAVTGVTVLALLPFAFLLAPLPVAVLAAIVLVAVVPLIRLDSIAGLWRHSRPATLIAVGTLAATLAFSPRIERGVLVGVGLSIAVHLWRELQIDTDAWEDGPTLHIKPRGVLWFGAAQRVEDAFLAELAAHRAASCLHLHLDGVGRLDITAALILRDVLDRARAAGLTVEVSGMRDQDRRLVDGVVLARRRGKAAR